MLVSMYTPFVVNSMHTLAHQNYKTSSERGYNVSILCYPDIETLQVISKAKQSTTSISLNCYICLFTASLTSLNHIIAILYLFVLTISNEGHLLNILYQSSIRPSKMV